MRILLAILLALATVPALAGSITITYRNDGGTALFTPSATISNADATKFLTWCHVHYAATPSASTDSGCYNAWANDLFVQTKNNVNDSLQSAAAAAATSVPIVLAPQQ